MLGKKETNTEKMDTLIGKNTTLKGTIETKGTIRFDGLLEGDLIVEGNIVIGAEGRINGNITCNNIVISGQVNGNITSKEQLRITKNGKLYGDIEVKNIIIDESALFEGLCKMNNVINQPISDKKVSKKETKKDK